MRRCHLSVRNTLLSSVLAFALPLAAAQARSFSVLHEFTGSPDDGSNPTSNVSVDAAGNALGTTSTGGTADAGVIYRIAPDETETVLHSFDGGRGGSGPNAGVTIDPSSGDLYGTTTFGGKNYCNNGCGVLYRLAADGAYKVLVKFNVSTGFWPVGQLLRDKKGNLFGITIAGGGVEEGTLFEYSARGHFSVVYSFGQDAGWPPVGDLIEDSAGDLFGVTSSGGAQESGTVFELKPNGSYTTLYSFTGGADGSNPTGGLGRDDAGNLYGTTGPGGNATPYGSVFKLAPDGTLTTLYVFTGGNDGNWPSGSLLYAQGKLYGTTMQGGTNQGGVVYAVDAASGAETVLHDFAGNDGLSPQAGLTMKNSRLYGTTAKGGTNNLGVVFSLKK